MVSLRAVPEWWNGRHGGLRQLSMSVGNTGMNGVKVGETFQVMLMATPSEGIVGAR